ncbi:hypothetical protein BGZ57DRAFT_854360 [Hyaloscypha finlandica]|nr:hypothetical protein BGZ57DRAFT_854360 [Hyaloscypha finlandica]
MARISARSSATHDLASLPPKQSNDRQSRSPVGRRTRSTRSQSADLGESDIPTSTRGGGKRGVRQVSVESIESNTSAASSRGGRTRKVTRAAAGARDLSMVAEDREENEDNEDEEEEEEDDDEAHQGTRRAQRSHSPGGMSQISGTTAISSFSARTSHSQGEIVGLDPMVAEMLPDLWNDSYRIMTLLAPADASEEQVESIVRELKVSGSRLAKRLRQNEKRFALTREYYGNEPYIKTALIFQRLLGSPNPAEASSRPDAIIQIANLATLVKDFLVMERESQSSQSILGGLDSYFPQVNGQLKDLMGASLELTDDQTAEVLQRVRDIRSAFRQSNDAIELGDLVDFDQLGENFSWVKFLTDLVHWSRMRLDEISEGIKQQGGVTIITQAFIEAIKNNDSQVDIKFDPPPPSSVVAPRRLQPAAEIMPGASGQSLYNGDQGMVRLLEKLKRTSSSNDGPAPIQQKVTVASSSAPQPKSKEQGASQAKASKTAQDVSPDDLDNNDLDGGFEEQPRSAEEYAQVWVGYSNERNKENRPAPKRRLVDRQPGARQMQWEDSQDSTPGPSTNKRKYQESVGEENEDERREEEEEEELSEDEGFQEDHRVPDPARRAAAPIARRQSPGQDAPSPPKRREIERPGNNTDRDVARRRQQRAKSVARANTRREVVNDDEDDETYPPPTFPQASLAAKLNVAQSRSRMEREPQKRVPWSDADSKRLIDGIEQFGCSWSVIAKNTDFDHPRDQIALKDKARNMKVTFLKANIVLPLNLENVPLGKKEIDIVRRVFPHYEP